MVITGGAPKEGDDMNSTTPEVRQIVGTSITECKVNGRPCIIYTQPSCGTVALYGPFFSFGGP